MFVIGNLINSVVGLLSILINLYVFIIIVSACLSWVRPDPYNGIVRAIRSVTEPVFYRIRKRMPFVVINGFDCSPIVALVALKLFDGVVVDSLLRVGRELAK